MDCACGPARTRARLELRCEVKHTCCLCLGWRREGRKLLLPASVCLFVRFLSVLSLFWPQSLECYFRILLSALSVLIHWPGSMQQWWIKIFAIWWQMYLLLHVYIHWTQHFIEMWLRYEGNTVADVPPPEQAALARLGPVLPHPWPSNATRVPCPPNAGWARWSEQKKCRNNKLSASDQFIAPPYKCFCQKCWVVKDKIKDLRK